ncbi:hypothetical protein PTI98_009605 [Pleurotus ostreatus]|nr:hypothetical protein PTI98_009605 [Pleurotus ostreatus]
MSKTGGWPNFRRIHKQEFGNKRFFISGSPNPTPGLSPDVVAKLTPNSVDFIVRQGINAVYTWNTWPLLYGELQLFVPKNIEYVWDSAPPAFGPKLDHLEKLWKFFRAHHTMLLVVADGDNWRTDIAIIALQLGCSGGVNPPEYTWRHKGVHDNQNFELLKKWKKQVRANLRGA